MKAMTENEWKLLVVVLIFDSSASSPLPTYDL